MVWIPIDGVMDSFGCGDKVYLYSYRSLELAYILVGSGYGFWFNYLWENGVLQDSFEEY